ncbi:uncharacterized protein [Musca autumnalis]|uniref:uncharacterized protein n=1 Tax=Musca autumnalis TaxID=221902 RepID=UPI003CE8E4C6
MSVAMRMNNGLHHAVSMGTIDTITTNTKPTCSSQSDRNYDSEDENTYRRRLRHTSSTELYPRPSQYSKGDIREQYCLTDRQINTIDRTKRERFFGCLSRRSTPQSFLGGCVGRRIPSDENLAPYTPFYKYSRYSKQFPNTTNNTSTSSSSNQTTADNMDMESSYFRRQPASILSTSKMVDAATDNRHWLEHQQQQQHQQQQHHQLQQQQQQLHQQQQQHLQQQQQHHMPHQQLAQHPSYGNYDNISYINDKSSYHCPSHMTVGAGMHAAGAMNTPRTKHVSFARSHTLTSFDDFNVGFRSSGRMKSAQSQERLIGGKKPLGPSGSYYDTMPVMAPPPPQITAIMGSTSTIHMLPTATVPVHQLGHTHQHYAQAGHLQGQTPQQPQPTTYIPAYVTEQHVQTQQPTAILNNRPILEELSNLQMATTATCPLQTLPPPSPEVIVVEKKFRNAMKTQATQTDVRKNEFEQSLALSPRTIHRVRVVSQGAQTNGGLANGKPLAKSLSQIPYDSKRNEEPRGTSQAEHELLHRTQSEEPPKSPLESSFPYYQPPPPLEYDTNHEKYIYQKKDLSSMSKEDSFSYESNSLPRRTCGYRLDTDFHSLPRRDMHNVQDVCKHITECSELMADGSSDFTSDLLPPPQEYCLDDDDSLDITQTYPKEYKDTNRRKSMLVSMEPPDDESPFRRDDIRRQSMPVYVKTEKLIDLDYVGKGSRRFNRKAFRDDMSDEKEIIIDFKPYIKNDLQPKTLKRKFLKKHEQQQEPLKLPPPELPEPYDSISAESDRSLEDQHQDPVYENLQACGCAIGATVPEAEYSEPEQEEKDEKGSGISAPPSPLREEAIGHASTYPSSDSLANDVTRDHSDGHWNESEVTVLMAEQRSEASYNLNLLLTPSTKRKHLLLQHQQRSSVDTDALDFEEQFTDQSPTYSQAGSVSMKSSRSPATPQNERETLVKSYERGVQPKLISPSIEITPSLGQTTTPSPVKPPGKALLASPRKSIAIIPPKEQRRLSDISVGVSSLTDNLKGFGDNSECSTNTNTEDYATCTDTSRRTPASTQSSQMDKTHGESSFESASSLYSSKGEMISEEIIQPDGEYRRESKTHLDLTLNLPSPIQGEIAKKSPSHSVSSTSSGSYNVGGIVDVDGETKTPENEKVAMSTAKKESTSPLGQRVSEQTRKKIESISDDERSDVRYSSSGYYESPHDDEYQKLKSRRYRQEEERKRRKTSMKIDIEKENMRALTSPIKRDVLKKSPERQKASSALAESTSPVKLKRFRPKIRRQLRRSSRDESATRTRKANNALSPQQITTGSAEKLLDASIMSPKPPATPSHMVTSAEHDIPIPAPRIAKEAATATIITSSKAPTSLSPAYVKSASETCQLKAKSIESLNRSVSPGSDSVFYSEADGNHADQHSGHCSHCGKEVDDPTVVCGDSVESLPYIDNEPDIVKPPSDFADSPVTNKTPQRLYKKMDKRFRSEERYHLERGRHYKTRKENIRAKSEERNQECNKKTTPILRPAGSSPCILPEITSETKQQTIYIGHYDCARYARLTDSDIWAQLDHQSLERSRGRRSSTDSEKSFYTKYQVILHRLVQRRCTLEMYHRQKNDTFAANTLSSLIFIDMMFCLCHQQLPVRHVNKIKSNNKTKMLELITSNSAQDSLRRRLEEILKLMMLVWAREGHVLSKLTNGEYGVDKTVVVKSDSGEFGFRIHGSKPVVVAAIEPDTPAESSGLEVGDIIISVNGVKVLDKHHTEVVKIAHDGCEKLELEVARTLGVLMNEQQEPPIQVIYSGYLWRQSGQAKGSPNAKKWVQRWFVLRSDNCLYYYKTEEDTQPVGAMIMAKHTVEPCPAKVGRPHAFKIDSGEGIPMYVAGDNEEITNRWLNILKKAVAQENAWLDKSARNLYKQPSNIQRPDCFGYLMKLGSKWCGWSKRYCVLKDACLYFFQDGISKSALGMVCLHGYKVSSMSAAASGKKYSFEIIPPEPKLRHYYFYTESEMEKKRWISALEYSIDRWIKSG